MILTTASVIAITLLILLGIGVWVGYALLICGWLAIVLFTNAPAASILGTATWGTLSNWSLSALPLFIWMGEILFRSKLTRNLFDGLHPWVSPLPGGLVHSNIIGSGIFAAVSGSSAATTATVGRITLPELLKRGYPQALSVGSLAGSGTLGMLIPPSIVMIVYGVTAQVSIVKLFLAGILPGLLIMGMFMAFVMISSLAGAKPKHDLVPQRFRVHDYLMSLVRLMPVILLISSVIGLLYSGIVTPTEAAAAGVVGSLLLSFLDGTLSYKNFVDGITATTLTSGMILLIMLGAAYLSNAMAFIGIPSGLAAWVTDQEFTSFQLIIALTILYLLLGCFLEGISMIVLTTAIVIPSVKAAGIDLIWFGIYIVIVIEIAQITPPVGLNLFIINKITNISIGQIVFASFPYFLLLLSVIFIIYVYPDIVLYIPYQL